MLTQETLKSLLHYDPETGVFTWLVSRRAGARIGNAAGAKKKKQCGIAYREITIDRREYGAHRLAVLYMTGSWPVGKVDHHDRNGLNNAWVNLRCATNSQNSGNAKLNSKNTSGFKGVTWNKRCGRWQSSIKRNNRTVYLGLFDDAADAHAAYAAAAKEHFGEFARAA